MEYFKASEEHAEQIYNLVQNTITAVYPRYYPEAVVDFFCIVLPFRRGFVFVT